jgi:protein-S-isoprenylcysteine O-methyltransferase Ste14
MEDAQAKITNKPSYLRIMIRIYCIFALMTAGIFLTAGRLDYWQGWIFVVAYFALLVAATSFYRHNRDLFAERIKPGPGVKWWDKIFFALYIPSALSVVFVAAIDAGRFRWSPELPVVLYPLMLVLMLFCNYLVLWAMRTNKFFSSRVRIQTDRGHYVITEGPYRFVRHPGYTGAIIFFFATALLLGSVYALIPVVVTIAIIVIRTYLEDVTLQRELPGYTDYTRKTKSRLVPGIW